MWFVHANLPIGRWTSVRTVDPHGENGSNPLLTLTLTKITSLQIQNKQASTPHHVYSTMQPPSKITVFKMYSCQYQPVKIIKSKRVAYATKYFSFPHYWIFGWWNGLGGGRMAYQLWIFFGEWGIYPLRTERGWFCVLQILIGRCNGWWLWLAVNDCWRLMVEGWWLMVDGWWLMADGWRMMVNGWWLMDDGW